MHLEQFVNSIKAIYEDSLESIVLFGSAAAGDFSDKYSDYNLIIVLKKVTPAALARSTRLVNKWVKAQNPIPLFFDPDHIRTSADVFPIEFYDIKASRKVLTGTDPFAGIKIEDTNLRHQCESELKGKILQIQAGYIRVADNDKEIARLMMESLSTFLSIFKGVVRLLGHEPEAKKRALVEQLATMISFNPNIFMELLNVRDGNAVAPRKDAPEKFEDYLEQIRVITDFVDRYETAV